MACTYTAEIPIIGQIQITPREAFIVFCEKGIARWID